MGSKSGSRIITTTRNASVAKECCSSSDDMVYNMKHLSDEDSRRLFYSRVFPRDTICPLELEQVSSDILKKCGGVPLAITTLAGSLAGKPKSQWLVLLNCIGRGLKKGDTNVEEMKRILSFSYYDLPSHLKTCLLYLSVFSEDWHISKDRLIRRWIAEGFIHGGNLFELGQSYFNELVNRSMIEPVSFDSEGKPEACRVHDMLLDLLCDLSTEENFITVLDAIKDDTAFEKKIRRLSLQKSMTELTNTRLATTCISQVRSFTIFSPAINQMLPLSRFQVLRVLDLESCMLGKSNLSCVGNLLHLRYLGLRYTRLREIPMDIGNLLFLQILDLEGLAIEELPASYVRLRNLIFLYVGQRTDLPVGFKNLTSLEELTGVWFREGGDDLEALGYLTELRVLRFGWSSRYRRERYLVLVESLKRLQKLESLDIWAQENDDSIDHMRSWIPSPHLRKLKSCGWFQILPAWISSSSLPLLSFLSINVHIVRPEDIQIIGTLPALLEVDLKASGHAERPMEKFMLDADAFPRARKCYFENVMLVPGMFTTGAMPLVQYLRFGLRALDVLSGDFDLTIRNLPSLQDLSIDLSSKKKFYRAEAGLRRVVADHPNRPLDFYIYGGSE